MCFSNGQPNGKHPIIGAGVSMMVGRPDMAQKQVGIARAADASSQTAAPALSTQRPAGSRRRRGTILAGGDAAPTNGLKTTLGS